MRFCSERYVSGYRQGQPCPYRASAIVLTPYGSDPFLVCGYHARGYLPEVIYPLDWSLAQVRRFQHANLEPLPQDG